MVPTFAAEANTYAGVDPLLLLLLSTVQSAVVDIGIDRAGSPLAVGIVYVPVT
jgi:hypothetical protein